MISNQETIKKILSTAERIYFFDPPTRRRYWLTYHDGRLYVSADKARPVEEIANIQFVHLVVIDGRKWSGWRVKWKG